MFCSSTLAAWRPRERPASILAERRCTSAWSSSAPARSRPAATRLGCLYAQADAEWREWRALHQRLVEQRPSAPAAPEREALRARGGALLADLLALVQERGLDR